MKFKSRLVARTALWPAEPEKVSSRATCTLYYLPIALAFSVVIWGLPGLARLASATSLLSPFDLMDPTQTPYCKFYFFIREITTGKLLDLLISHSLDGSDHVYNTSILEVQTLLLVI